MPPGCRYFDRLRHPDLTSVDDELPHLPESQWRLPEPFDEELLNIERETARRLCEQTDRALVSSTILGMPAGYCGPIGWAVKLHTAPGHARAYMMAEADALARRARQYLEVIGRYLEMVMISGVDFGTQSGELFDPRSSASSSFLPGRWPPAAFTRPVPTSKYSYTPAVQCASFYRI